MYLEFDVRHQTISRTDEFEVVANSLHYLFARFTFSEEWEGKQQTAIFSMNNGTNISVLLTDGECEVPWEVLRGREFWVGVFAGDRITTTPVRVPVQASVNLNASPGVQPTPSAYELLVQRVEDALKKGPHIGPNDNWWVWDATANDFVDTGVYSHGYTPRIVGGTWWVGDMDTGVAAAGKDGKDGVDGIDGADGYTPVKGVDYFDGVDGYTPVKGVDYFDGVDGNSIASITRTAGTGAPGTTDTYTVTLTDGSTTSFSVYNGADGSGAGDMTALVYDPRGKKTDIFKAIDDAVAGLVTGAHADTHATGGSDPITPEMIGAIRKAIEIPGGADLNDYKEPGEYYKDSGAETLANYPSAYGSFALKVERTGAYGVGVTQTLKDHQGNVYVRSYAVSSGSDWSAWDELGKANDFLRRDGGNTMNGVLYMDDVSGSTMQKGYILEWMGNFHLRNYYDDNNFTDIVMKTGDITPTVVQVKDGVMTEHAIYHAGNLPVEAATAEIVE